MKTTAFNLPRREFRVCCLTLHPLALAAVLLAATQLSQAAVVVYCVSSSTELQNALDKASDGGIHNGQDNRIHIVQGTYGTAANSPAGPFGYDNSSASGDLIIEGGYDAGCNTRSTNPLLTQLDGNYVSKVMDLRSARAEIDISGVTIQHGNAISDGGGLTVNPAATNQSGVVIFGSVIRNNHTSKFAGGLFAGVGGGTNFISVRNTLFVDNSADQGIGGAELVGDGAGVLFYNNTVYQNTTASNAPAAIGGVECTSAECQITNNIIWGNTNIGLQVFSSAATLDYNDIGNYQGTFQENLGNQSVAPKFVDAANDDFHLAANSTLLAVSSILFGGVDIEGNAYPATGVQDMGAFEETIFAGDFEPLPPK